jgi:twitching motility protein PilT
MRDLETIQLAITAAETGHLCFGTLHTQDAPSTIDRIIDVFPPHQQAQVRVQLAVVLQAVVCQQLVPRKDGEGRVGAREIMIMTPAISNLIREGKTHMLYQAIDTGAKHGMIPMDKSLADLVRSGLISADEALTRANNQETFKQLAGITGKSGASMM